MLLSFSASSHRVRRPLAVQLHRITNPAMSAPSLSATGARAREWLDLHSRELEAAVEALRALAVLGGGRGVDVRAEALSSFLSLLRVYRDARGARPAVIALEAARAVALLVEMAARRRARGGIALTLLELAKAGARLSLLATNGCQMLRDAETRLKAPKRCNCGVGALPAAARVQATAGARTGRTILKPKGGELDDLFAVAFERRRANSFRAVAPAPADCDKCRARSTPIRPIVEDEVQRVQMPARSDHAAAEILHVARPLAQLCLLRLFGWRSWKAWGCSLAIDMSAIALVKRPETMDEATELRRRQLNLLLYLVRSPMFDILLRIFVRRIERVLRRIPLVGAPISTSVELLVMLQRFWFYTAGS